MAQIFFGSGPSGLWHDALTRNRNLRPPESFFFADSILAVLL
jgi:hypothetical protein